MGGGRWLRRNLGVLSTLAFQWRAGGRSLTRSLLVVTALAIVA